MSTQLKTYNIDVPDESLRAGHNRIELAFNRATVTSAEDGRALAALFRSIELVPKRDDFIVNVALAESRNYLKQGFNPSEQAGDITFVWSDGPASELEGTLAWPRSPYLLETFAEAVPLVPTQRTRVIANGKFVGTMSFGTRWATQRLIIPVEALRKGKNRIRFEYEAVARPAAVDKKLGDQRDLAVRFRRIELTPLIGMSNLDVGVPASRPYLIEGWSVDEHDGDRTVAWTNGPRASAVLSLMGVRKPILRLSGEGYNRALPLNVTVALNDKPVASFAAPDGWQNIAIPLPDVEYSATGNIVTFQFDRTAQPADDNPRSRDRRDLALRVDRIWVESSDSDAQNIKASVPAASSEPSIASRSLEAAH
jgi:hypothetical protein